MRCEDETKSRVTDSINNLLLPFLESAARRLNNKRNASLVYAFLGSVAVRKKRVFVVPVLHNICLKRATDGTMLPLLGCCETFLHSHFCGKSSNSPM